ncbi:type II secretion system F family protein [Pseudonocardia sp. N23]|uniref:type II secretion system F family protein n=1 Tax=Pseudonocardia sp. N23 TaxID=1987376 RepID=UPI000BFE7EB6|nr:type II secretion system F family protein [Pseudonocardia sp. N23]GAY09298.1 possible conserved alanine rich membrane protein [Pseudonocardia sp. N23]
MSPLLAAVALLAAAALVTTDVHVSRTRLRLLYRSAPVLLAAPTPATLRRGWTVTGGVAVGALAAAVGGAVAGVTLGALVTGAFVVLARRARAADAGESPAELAGGWELLAVCLDAGLPLPTAVDATALRLSGPAGRDLRRVAGLLELGADPVEAWQSAAARPALAVFSRAARRSAATGSGIAHVARTEAVRLRGELVDTARARAQRAAVTITGPLGLCFLPAFLVLGIAPVVVGLAGDALALW